MLMAEHEIQIKSLILSGMLISFDQHCLDALPKWFVSSLHAAEEWEYSL